MNDTETEVPDHILASSLYNRPIRGLDGRVGRIHDLAVDERTWRVRHILVDTGFWRLGRRVLLMPQLLRREDDGETFCVALTRRQVRRLPHHLDDPTVSAEAYGLMTPVPPHGGGMLTGWTPLPIEPESRLRSLRAISRYALVEESRRQTLGRARDVRLHLPDWRVASVIWRDPDRKRHRLVPDQIDKIVFRREMLYVSAPAAG